MNLVNKMTPNGALQAFNGLLNAYKDNHKVTEEESTKRENIRAYRDIEIERIQGQKEILKDYFKHSFAERKENFDRLFDSLDKGLEANNPDLIINSIGAITAIANESPLNSMQNIVNQLKSGDVKTIEI